jgi:NAD(P)-dependent dehydrogenase (short-subunit alcohol dehydrogenase family)
MIEKPVALVTGGAKGIGAACCRALAEEGFYIGIHYRKSKQKAQNLLAEIKDGFLISADLTSIEQIDAMIGKLKDAAGRVDVLVNNAGESINADIL